MTASTISTPIRAPRSLRRRVFATALLLLPLLVGCFHGRLPARELYRLRLPENADTSPIQDHDGGTLPTATLAIVPYVAPGNREWALPVPTMLGMLTEDVLRRRPITAEQAVFDPPSPHNYTYIWRGLVRELEEVDRGRDVFAAVRLDARLVRASDDSVIWTGTARVERRVPSPSMTAIVDTLSQLTAEAVSQLLETARAALLIPAASAVRARRPDAVDRS